MRETVKTGAFLAAAAVLALLAAVRSPESATPEILNDQGQAFYPKFTDPRACRTVEVVDYDEATATARPFKVQFERGRWIIPSHHNYPIDSGDRLVKTAAALIDLRKDRPASDSVLDHARHGVIDPLDEKAASLAGRGKRITLRDARGDVLADYIVGKAVEGKSGQRYVRVPGQKRTYVVKTEADASARFTDWVNAGVLRVAASALRKITLHSYAIGESFGRLSHASTITLTRENGKWTGDASPAAIQALVNTLDTLKIVDVKPKPPALAQDLRNGQLSLSLETAVSLRQRGFYLTPTGRLLANEGELHVEAANGVLYVLRFGEIAAGSENRHLFVTVHYDPQRAAKYGDTSAAGERQAHELTTRFADWYYVISGSDFQKLRLKPAAPRAVSAAS